MLQQLPPSADRLAASRDVIVERTLRLARREWAAMAADYDTSWAVVGPRIRAIIVLAQRDALTTAAAYVPAALADIGASVAADAAVDASGLVGVASDGRDLDTLLRHAVVVAKDATGAGASTDQSLQAGGSFVDSVTRLQTIDALRVATGLHIAVRPRTGWVRMLQGASCGRCVVLAGKWYRWNRGFQRHPNCDCVHVPAPESVSGDMTVDPQAAFDAMTPAQQVKSFGAAGAKAIRDGADPAQVVNARRGAWGMAPAGGRLTRAEKEALQGGERGRLATRDVFGRQVYTTTEGTTKRGLAGKARPGRIRLMPESIYDLAGGDRDEALRLLRVHGYIR